MVTLANLELCEREQKKRIKGIMIAIYVLVNVMLNDEVAHSKLLIIMNILRGN